MYCIIRSRIEAKKIGVVSQTTLDQETFCEVVSSLACGAKELRVYNTICESTSVRRDEAIDVAGKVDAMLIVGGKNSSNTTKLFSVGKAHPAAGLSYRDGGRGAARMAQRRAKSRDSGGGLDPRLIIEKVERRVKNL